MQLNKQESFEKDMGNGISLKLRVVIEPMEEHLISSLTKTSTSNKSEIEPIDEDATNYCQMDEISTVLENIQKEEDLQVQINKLSELSLNLHSELRQVQANLDSEREEFTKFKRSVIGVIDENNMELKLKHPIETPLFGEKKASLDSNKLKGPSAEDVLA